MALFVHFRGRVRHKFHRQLTDHSTIIAPYNAIMYGFSAVPNQPVRRRRRAFPSCKPLQDNWQMIRDEAIKLFDEGHIRAAAKYNDLGFNSFFRRGWKRFYLKWYDAPLPSAHGAVPENGRRWSQSIPTINGAMFAMLPPAASSAGIAIRSPDRCAITSAWSRRTATAAASSSTARRITGATARP